MRALLMGTRTASASERPDRRYEVRNDVLRGKGDYFEVQDDCKDGYAVAALWQVGLPCGWGQPPCPPRFLINNKGKGTMVRHRIHWEEDVPTLYRACTIKKDLTPIKCSEAGHAVT